MVCLLGEINSHTMRQMGTDIIKQFKKIVWGFKKITTRELKVTHQIRSLKWWDTLPQSPTAPFTTIVVPRIPIYPNYYERLKNKNKSTGLELGCFD